MTCKKRDLSQGDIVYLVGSELIQAGLLTEQVQVVGGIGGGWYFCRSTRWDETKISGHYHRDRLYESREEAARMARDWAEDLLTHEIETHDERVRLIRQALSDVG